jgi:cell division protein FtsW
MAYKPGYDKIIFLSQHGTSYYFFLRQLLYALGGSVLLVLLMNVDYHVWQKPKFLLFMIVSCAATLGFVLTQPKVNGAHRWLHFGFATFQPSEVAKLIVLIFIAGYLQKHEKEINQPRRLLSFGLIIGLFAGLIAIEPDLGQALCLCIITAVLLFSAGLAWRYFACAILMVVPAFYLFVVRVPYRWERIKAFLDPFQDPLGSGWQISQSLIAVGSGGFMGLGLGGSKQKLFFLPEAPSDFIYAIIGEELGLLGTLLVILAFLLYFYRGIRIILQSPDRFGFYLGLGITLMVVLQGFINISMVLAMMPTKGIALPFMSQGGSSLLLNLLATGILLNLSHHNKLAEAAA